MDRRTSTAKRAFAFSELVEARDSIGKRHSLNKGMPARVRMIMIDVMQGLKCELTEADLNT